MLLSLKRITQKIMRQLREPPRAPLWRVDWRRFDYSTPLPVGFVEARDRIEALMAAERAWPWVNKRGTLLVRLATPEEVEGENE